MCEKKAGRWGFHLNLMEIMEAVMEQRQTKGSRSLFMLVAWELYMEGAERQVFPRRLRDYSAAPSLWH